MQIDDLFLDTEEPFNTAADYRMNKADSTALATFAANVPNLPAGSSFRVRCVAGCSLHALLTRWWHPSTVAARSAVLLGGSTPDLATHG